MSDLLNRNELRAYFAKNGMTQKDVAKRLGITENTLSKKIKDGVFGSDEIKMMIEMLGITNPLHVFFNL